MKIKTLVLRLFYRSSAKLCVYSCTCLCVFLYECVSWGFSAWLVLAAATKPTPLMAIMWWFSFTFTSHFFFSLTKCFPFCLPGWRRQLCRGSHKFICFFFAWYVLFLHFASRSAQNFRVWQPTDIISSTVSAAIDVCVCRQKSLKSNFTKLDYCF